MARAPQQSHARGAPAPNRPVTMRDIARRVGVSQPVVSKALFDGPTSVRLSPALREAVRQAAQELGYRPNAAARSLSARRFRSVNLLQYAYRNWSYLPQELLEALLAALTGHGLGLSIQCCGPDDLASEDAGPRLLRETDADGLLVNVNHPVIAPLQERLHRERVPAVWLNCDLAVDAVLPDDRSAARSLTELLLTRGARRIRYLGYGINPEENHYSKSERPAGYAEALRGAGLEPCIILGGGPERLAALCSGPEGPGTWIAYGAGEAEALLRLACERGWRLGRDLHLGLFTPPTGVLRSLATAVAEEPLAALGAAAAEMLATKLDDPGRALASRRLPWRIALPETGP